jgi:hypothetical protein
LSINADISTSVDLLGKTVDQLQSSITVGADSISGTLLYVDDYTGFSEDTELQSGNYLALHFEVPEADDATITVALSDDPEATNVLDEDGIAVLRVTDTDQTVSVTASKTGYESVTKTYSLTGLTLNNS